MTIGIIGKKVGMTRVFTEDGSSVPVTVIQVEPNVVTQIKTLDTDGYEAIQVCTGEIKASKVNKPMAGHFAKAGVTGGRTVMEFRVDPAEYEVGKELGLDIFTEGQKVDVTGRSKGKGFAGVIKRHNFAMQDATHGNSLSHRAPGSIGQRHDSKPGTGKDRRRSRIVADQGRRPWCGQFQCRRQTGRKGLIGEVSWNSL